jgi:perosamine synthetase
MKHPVSQYICEVYEKIVGKNHKFIPLHEPIFIGKENEYLQDCIQTTFVSSVGKYVDLFERKIADYCGTENSVVVVNGTCGIHLAIKSLSLPEKSEIILPTLTFVGTASAIVQSGCIPNFVDIENQTLGVDPIKLETYLNAICELTPTGAINKKTNNRISAIIPVHIFGNECKIDELIAIASKYKLKIIEDAAEALGSKNKGEHIGLKGHIGVISFNGNKIITTGNGGALISHDNDLLSRAKHLSTTAKINHQWKYQHDEIGYNYRLSNLSSSVGCAQIENLDFFLEKKQKLNIFLKTNFENFDGINFHDPKSIDAPNNWLNAILLGPEFKKDLDLILYECNKNKIMTRPIWEPLHSLKPYKNFPKSNITVANEISKKLINIPSSANLL